MAVAALQQTLSAGAVPRGRLWVERSGNKNDFMALVPESGRPERVL